MALLLLQVTCLLLLSLFTLSTSLEDNPSVITKTDRDILSAMRTTFTDLYNQENVGNFKQFAVMYYGTSAEIPATIVTEECKTQAGNKVFLDDIKSDFDVSINALSLLENSNLETKTPTLKSGFLNL